MLDYITNSITNRKKIKSQKRGEKFLKHKESIEPKESENDLGISMRRIRSTVNIPKTSKTVYEEIESKISKEKKKEESLQDSEKLMNKIVESFLESSNVISEEFNGNLETINSMDSKLIKLQMRLRELMSDNAFYSKEINRLKVGTFRISRN